MNIEFHYGKYGPKTAAGEIIQKWHKELLESPGERASLRRAKSSLEVALQPAYYRLFNELQKVPKSEELYLHEGRLATLAGLLSHIKPHKDGLFALTMGSQKEGRAKDSAVVSALRFRKILRIEDAQSEEFYLMMIRFIRMLDNKADIYDLANSILNWNDKMRKKWAARYYLKEDYYGLAEEPKEEGSQLKEEAVL